MQLKQFFQSLNDGVTFVLGLLFIFGIGVLYAYIRPIDILLNVIFLTITLGWVIFTIKYIWDALEKKDKPPVEPTNSQEITEFIKATEEELKKKETQAQ